MLPGRCTTRAAPPGAARARRMTRARARSRSPGPCSARRRSARCSTCCARASSRSARACPPSRRRSPRASAPARLRGLLRHRRAAPRAARGRRRGRRRGRHLAVLLRRLRQRHPLRARAARVRRHRPAHAEPRPRRGRRGASPGRTAALLPVHIFGYPADVPALERHGLPIVEDACEALGARPRRRHAGGRARAPGRVRLLRQQAAHHGRGRHGHDAARPSTRRASTRSATRAARPTWAGSTTTGWASTTGSPTSPARSASPSSSGSTTCSAARARVAGWYREALAGLAAERGSGCPARTRGGDVRGWFVFVVQVPAGRDRDATMLALRERGVQSKPYLPAIHLMSFYRERFGHRAGRVPGLRGRRRAARSRCRSSRRCRGPGRARRRGAGRGAQARRLT